MRFGRKMMFRSCDIETFVNDRRHTVEAAIVEPG
jgi:hypothetical protein